MPSLARTGDFFFEMVGDACAILENGHFIRANHSWQKILGRPGDELIGCHWSQLFDAEDGARMSEAMSAAAATDGRFADVEVRGKHADGGHRWLLWSGYTDSGRWLLSARDVTESRRAFEKIRLQAQLLDAVDAAVIASDRGGAIIDWSAGAERMLGWTGEEVVGDRLMVEMFTPQDAAQVERILQTIRRDGHWEGELDVRRKDGTALLALVRCTPYYAEQGDHAGFVGVAVDMTEQVDARRNLEAAHDYLRAVTESMTEASARAATSST